LFSVKTWNEDLSCHHQNVRNVKCDFRVVMNLNERDEEENYVSYL